MYAACIKQRLTPSDIAALVDLVHHLSLKIKGGCGSSVVGVCRAAMGLLARQERS